MAAIALQPLDVIKTRLQQAEGYNERNFKSLIKSTK